MRRKCLMCLFGGVIAVSLAAESGAQVIINEVVPNPAGSQDEIWEYIELYGRPGMSLDGYAIALLKGGRDLNRNGVFDPGEAVPEIDEAFSLDGLSLGSDGFLVLYNDTGGFSNLINLNMIHPDANIASFTATHIDPPWGTDTPGKLENDGSSTFVLVRKRHDHSLDEFGQSQYGPEYSFYKDVRHDVNGDGDVDFGTELNLINTGEPARRVEHFQVVDDLAWSHDGGKEYHRTPGHEFSETPGFNPDGVSRLHYYIRNPQRGYHSVGNAPGPFSIKPTAIADEAFIYGELFDVFPGDPNFFAYNTGADLLTGYPETKAPTNMAAPRYTGLCDPEPDNGINPACTPSAGGAYEFTDIDVTGFKLTPGTFNDHPTDTSIAQFRFLRGDFNCDGFVNQIDRRLIEDRLGATLDDVVATVYDPTPGSPASGDEVAYDRFLRHGPEFQLVLMMREMDMTDGPGGTNADAVTQADIDAFLTECIVCGNSDTPPAIRITEYAYSAAGGEFIEFTNLSGAPVDMTGWSYDDDSRIPGVFDLSAFGVVQPGESVILTEADRAVFAIQWNIVGTKIIGLLDVNLGRNDEINLYDDAGQLVDRLTYGDQTFPGTIRTQNFSGWPCDVAVGANDIANWRLSLAGDAQGSFVSALGDVGSPGAFVFDDCTTTPPIGACCVAGNCVDGPTATQAYCAQIGGFYQGNETTCGTINCPQPSDAIVRITEYMYSGPGGEFIEITNLDTIAADLTGWSFDDSNRTPGAFSIGGLGTLQPGETGIITEADAEAFRTHWGLPISQKIVGDLGLNGIGNNLGRNDEINIYDAAGLLIDRLTYGDQDFPGTIRTQNVSAWVCNYAIGTNNINGWSESLVGDVQGSINAAGAIGNPGAFMLDACGGGEPIGACCFANGSCSDGFTQGGCESLFGTWQGEGTTCALVECPQPQPPQIRITEWMYNPLAGGGEFVELTNIGDTPIDMTGWSFDDDSRLPFSTMLTAFGVVAPGQSVVFTESTVEAFDANWSLAGSVVIIGGVSNNLGRNDEINIFDENGDLVDRLTYGDQTFPGSIRTQGISGWTCHQNLGANNVYDWQLSVVGDEQNSYNAGNGDRGSPGTYVSVPCSLCATCMGDADENGNVNLDDIAAFVNCALGNAMIDDCRCADMVEDGVIDGRDIQAFADALIGSPGTCP